MHSPTYNGIAVAKARLDVAVRPSSEQWVSATDAASLLASSHHLAPPFRTESRVAHHGQFVRQLSPHTERPESSRSPLLSLRR